MLLRLRAMLALPTLQKLLELDIDVADPLHVVNERNGLPLSSFDPGVMNDVQLQKLPAAGQRGPKQDA